MSVSNRETMLVLKKTKQMGTSLGILFYTKTIISPIVSFDPGKLCCQPCHLTTTLLRHNAIGKRQVNEQILKHVC